ncbi:hypothetical protein BOX15_Mlig021898g1 [Macrostomum lignano]|uniref:Uncharacterized protein n=1 Tax=Macrostomum lignano TaxID=282301 RepID=A0A267F8Q9_9PLAT|nr:hypothetical protein BOX15_Mlig021898g1 [Macrostomum lignano]
MAFFTPEMRRLQDEYMETMKTRDEMRDMLVTSSREHAVNGFSQDLEQFTKTVELAYSMVNQIDLSNADESDLLKTIQEVNRGIHYANTTLRSIHAKFNEMQNAVCHQQLLDVKKEKALPNLSPSDYVVLRDLIVTLHTEFDSVDSVYLSTWKTILLLKCLGYREPSQRLMELIEDRISRSAARKSDSRRCRCSGCCTF